ncbi:MAG: hypothetical protein Q7R76_06715 [Candidatus Woesearchaeota archaeon]|nr:hypothetical protein [Candidatus Woesearchaeota archaeon]
MEMRKKEYPCNCGGTITVGEVPFMEFLIPGYQCTRCKEITFSRSQAEYALELKKANQHIHSSRKIIKVGSSIAALLPKKLTAYGVKPGMVSEICVLGPRSLQLKFNKDLF